MTPTPLRWSGNICHCVSRASLHGRVTYLADSSSYLPAIPHSARFRRGPRTDWHLYPRPW